MMTEDSNVAVNNNEEVEPTSSRGRVRKAVQTFQFVPQQVDDTEDFVPPTGPGTALRELPGVEETISKMGKKDAETLKVLYSIMYGRRYQQKNMKLIKEHILSFSGFPSFDEKAREQLESKVGRWMRKFLQEVMDILGVDRSKKSFDETGKPFDKDSLLERLIDWLVKPHVMEGVRRKSTATKSTKSKKSSSKAKAGTKRKSSTTKTESSKTKKAKTTKTATKKNTTKKKVVDEEQTESEEEEDDDEHEEDSDSDFDEKKAPAKNKKSPAKKKALAAADDDDDDEEEDEEEEDENEEQEKESKSLSVKKASSPSLSSEVQGKIQEIIKKGNVEMLTVKKIIKQLSEAFDCDMSDKKKEIKSFITSAMSD